MEGTGFALSTSGPVMMNGIGEGNGKVLTSDASGNASWQNITGSHNHFGETWTGDALAGLIISNTRSTAGGFGLYGYSGGPSGVGVQGSSDNATGVGVLASVTHGEASFPPHESNSALVGINTTGNGLYATSFTGYSIKAVKQNFAPVSGTVALFANYKTTGTEPVVFIQNLSTNPTALELNNGYLKVSGTNKTAFTVVATAGNSSGHILTLSYPNQAATDILLVTHNYNPPAILTNYLSSPYSVYWNGTSWTIYLDDFAPILNKSFNVMVIKQ
jgi:hypothetical protein